MPFSTRDQQRIADFKGVIIPANKRLMNEKGIQWTVERKKENTFKTSLNTTSRSEQAGREKVNTI